MIFEGALAIKAIIESRKRPIDWVWIDESKKTKDVGYILWLCKEHQIPVERVVRQAIDDKAQGKTHGGIIASAQSRITEEWPTKPLNFVLLVEGIEDPFNLGQMIRTAVAAGVEVLITTWREWGDSETTITKSSAGASERITWIFTNDLPKAITQIKQAGLSIVSAVRTEKSKSIYDVDLKKPVCICIGGEMRGLSRPIIEASDDFAHIMYPNQTRTALSATAAATVCLFETVRQRQVK